MKNEKSLRYTHPTLFKCFVILALINIGLGLNFFFTNPTFNPYGYKKEVTGLIFFLLGVIKLFFLVFQYKIKYIRMVGILSIGFILFWGIGTSITFFQGKTSLQLFVLYVGLSAIHYVLMREPFLNPVTEINSETKVPIIKIDDTNIVK